MFGKRNRAFLISVVIMISLVLNPEYANADVSVFDNSQIDKGILFVDYSKTEDNDFKLMISKDGVSYTYTLYNKDAFPLQMGNGSYKINILEKVSGKKYRIIEAEDINLNLDNDIDVFLQSTQIVNWNNNMKAIRKAEELTKNKKTDLDKVKAVYNYIIDNVSYDKIKAKNIKPGYIPSINEIYQDKTGICYDYAALLAAMLRGINVPTKLVMGHKSDIKSYHAWNQVYISESKKWITIDTTYNAGARTDNDMCMKSKDYTVEKIY